MQQKPSKKGASGYQTRTRESDQPPLKGKLKATLGTRRFYQRISKVGICIALMLFPFLRGIYLCPGHGTAGGKKKKTLAVRLALERKKKKALGRGRCCREQTLCLMPGAIRQLGLLIRPKPWVVQWDYENSIPFLENRGLLAKLRPRRFGTTHAVPPRRRQAANGPLAGYPDRKSHRGWQRRASIEFRSKDPRPFTANPPLELPGHTTEPLWNHPLETRIHRGSALACSGGFRGGVAAAGLVKLSHSAR